MLIPCCCFFIISNDNCKDKPPMQMLDLKTKDCILLQLIISYHYNTHLFYIEYGAYFFYVTLCISMRHLYVLYIYYIFIVITYIRHFYAEIQWRRYNAWITVDVILWRMDHCRKCLPNSEEETFGEVLRGVQYGSVSALQINISPRRIRISHWYWYGYYKVSCIAYVKSLYVSLSM